ncbi:Os11g0113400 [Oryza sativa Japonica Group]|uniref:Os11g0113400 protein n=1 Tax=Oryza sativa subsp. japonica TaxID=39947 RepID=A0A0P0XYA8_ORYSJ|nr:Os11g0113400 [Oryza sativa Japonica Group]
MGRRRYLNLLVHNNHDDLYSLRRIPANRLFYPSARAAEAAAMAKSYIDHDGKRPHPGALHFMDRFRNFPCPLLNLQPTPMHHRNERSLDLVTLLGDDETKILTADNHGHTVLFDAASYSVVHFPNLNCSKGYDAMAVSINQEPDCLYVLNLRHHPTTSNHCFEVLSYGVFCERIPIWRSLPPPPFTTTTQTTITSYTTLSTFLPSSVALTPLTR